jgi:hypothetical protein
MRSKNTGRSSQRTSSWAGMAPFMLLVLVPDLKAMKVGMAWMPHSSATSGTSSTSTE